MTWLVERKHLKIATYTNTCLRSDCFNGKKYLFFFLNNDVKQNNSTSLSKNFSFLKASFITEFCYLETRLHIEKKKEFLYTLEYNSFVKLLIWPGIHEFNGDISLSTNTESKDGIFHEIMIKVCWIVKACFRKMRSGILSEKIRT